MEMCGCNRSSARSYIHVSGAPVCGDNFNTREKEGMMAGDKKDKKDKKKKKKKEDKKK